MALNLTVNGTTYAYPQTGDVTWGDAASNWASAVTSGMLQKAGGAFTLTADVDFGANYGLKSAYFSTRTSNPAGAGVVRLANDEGLGWRNAANSANLILKVNSSNQLEYNGNVVGGTVPVNTGGTNITSYTTGDMIYASGATTLSKLAIGVANKVLAVNSGATAPEWVSITNANVDPSEAIAYSKLNLSNSIVAGDITSDAVTTAKILNSNVTTAKIADSNVTTAKIADANVTTVKIADANVTMAKIAAVDRIPARNWIINGAFDFWQRGTSFSSVASGTYVADRFAYFKATTGAAHTISQEAVTLPTLAESGFQSRYAVKFDCTTADSSLAAGDLVYARYGMEGYDWAALKGREVTLSFWVYATKTGTYCVAFRNNGADRSYVAEYTVSATNTWEKKTITLTLNPSGGTDNFANDLGLSISWTLMGGSTYQTTAGAWQSGDYFATSNQVNACDHTDNNFFLTQVMLNIGAVAAPFTRAGHTIAEELSLCQRYYEKSYDVTVAPGTATTASAFYWLSARTFSATQTTNVYKVSKRTTPNTASVYSAATGTIDKVRDTSAASDVTASTTGAVGMNQHSVTFAGNDGAVFIWHWTADADFT